MCAGLLLNNIVVVSHLAIGKSIGSNQQQQDRNGYGIPNRHHHLSRETAQKSDIQKNFDMTINTIDINQKSWTNMFFFLQDQSDADLRNKIDLLQLTLLKVKCETEAEIRRLCREVEEKNEILRQLRRQLEEQGDYKELQQQARYSSTHDKSLSKGCVSGSNQRLLLTSQPFNHHSTGPLHSTVFEIHPKSLIFNFGNFQQFLIY